MNNNNEPPKRLHGEEGQAFARTHLVQLKLDSTNWRVLWRNPRTGELWKEYFPYPEAHGGGPSEFVRITEEEAKKEFGSF
jgi:hypothetical protein